ncbi:hypothetical protein D3C80_2098100 [compost metagenome]
MLAAQAACELGGQATQGLALGVDHVPVTLDGLVFGGESLHDVSGVCVVGLIPQAIRLGRTAEFRHAL